MKYLVRRIGRAKWDQKKELPANSIGADAVTSDLRTNGNELSFWVCEANSGEELKEVVLAMASGNDRPDRIDIAWFDASFLEKENVAIEHSEGRTPVADLRKRHVDAVRLDLSALGKIATHFATAIRDKEQFKRLQPREVIGLLRDAVLADRLKLDDLADKLHQSVEEAIDAIET